MSKVEDVARSIYERRNGHGCKPWSIQTNAHKAPYIDDARAAIEAMREPTEAMLGIDAPDMPAGGGVGEIWQDMIDAALNPFQT